MMVQETNYNFGNTQLVIKEPSKVNVDNKFSIDDDDKEQAEKQSKELNNHSRNDDKVQTDENDSIDLKNSNENELQLNETLNSGRSLDSENNNFEDNNKELKTFTIEEYSKREKNIYVSNVYTIFAFRFI